MGKVIPLSEARYRQIQKRQSTVRWGSEYIPAILATREEAPSISRPCKIWSAKLNRDLHALSTVERDAMLIALYHPNLLDLHEQRVLSCLPCMHPLASYPGMQKTYELTSMRGTVAVAEALGVLSHHAVFYINDPKDDTRKIPAPFPWIGDFLLYLEDDQGPYCVNWTIKARAEQFTQPFTHDRRFRNKEQAQAKEEARHKVEEIYYADAGIRTVRITRDGMKDDLVATLSQLYSWHARQTPFSTEQTKAIIDHFRAGMAVGEPPLTTIESLQMSEYFDRHDLKAVLFQAIWSRQLRVDLFQPIFIDQPLQPEKQDVLEAYKHWFARSPS